MEVLKISVSATRVYDDEIVDLILCIILVLDNIDEDSTNTFESGNTEMISFEEFIFNFIKELMKMNSLNFSLLEKTTEFIFIRCMVSFFFRK
jgi:hypothetical protein